MKFQRNIRGGGGRATTALPAILFCLASGLPAPGQTTPPTTPTQTIIPVQFNGANGDITIGATTYKGGNFHIVAISRQPDPRQLDAPDLIWDRNYTNPTLILSDLDQLTSTHPDAMILVNAPNYGFNLWQVGYKFVPFGATIEVGNMPPTRFVFVGINGLAQGAAPLQRTSPNSVRPVNGYLAPDSNGNYAFIQTDFVRYDLDTTDGDITIGGKKYTVADSYRVGCDGRNSFHLVVVDREDPTILDPTSLKANNTYCTGSSDNEISRLAHDLDRITSDFKIEALLVFLTTNGSPIPSNVNYGGNGDGRFTWFAAMVRTLGGFYETIVSMRPGDTFSLVGAAPPPTGYRNSKSRARESSSVYPEVSAGKRPTGELHGVLARSGRGNFYSPLNADPSGYANLGFYEVLATPSANFPRPNGAAEVAAYQYINSNLCGSGCNIRDLYDDLNVSFSNYQNTLQAMKDSNGQSCDASGSTANSDFCNVRGQLLTEFTHVNNIRAFYNNLNSLWLGSGTVTINSQLAAYNQIKAQISTPDTAPSQSLTLPLVHLFLGLAIAIPEIGPVFGMADVILNFATEMTTDEKGNQTIDLTSTIGSLLDQANTQFTAQATTTGTLFQLVYQDWGKLNALGTALATQTNRNSPWYWASNATGLMLNEMLPAVRQAAYQTIMAAAYAIGSYSPRTWGQFPLYAQPQSYGVIIDASNDAIPFNLANRDGVPFYTPYTFPGDTSNPYYAGDHTWATLLGEGTWLAISQKDTPWTEPHDFLYAPPDADIRKLLFNPVGKGGLGVYPPAFFNHWPFPRVTCTPYSGYKPDWNHTSVGGCVWNAAAPAPEQLVSSVRGPLTGLAIRAFQSSLDKPRKPEVHVQLAIHNSGTADINTVSIDSITVRTLGIGGFTTLTGPAVPVQLTNLGPGKTAHAFLNLNVPLGVTRISVTQQGTMTSGVGRTSSTFRFSEAQSLILR